MLSSLESELNLGFLDDVSLGGPVGTVAADVVRIAKEGGQMGLHLNASKCELIAHQESVVTDELLRSFCAQRFTLGCTCFMVPNWTNRGAAAVMIWLEQRKG